MSEKRELKLSNQAVACLMMALQRSLLEQSDIVPILESWVLVETPDGLNVANPPIDYRGLLSLYPFSLYC